MARFQLVFRDSGEEWSELHDCTADSEPQVGGKKLSDGETYVFRGRAWVLRREDAEDITRFICAPLRQSPTKRLAGRASG